LGVRGGGCNEGDGGSGRIGLVDTFDTCKK